MSLRTWLGLAYGGALLLPLSVYLGLYRPASGAETAIHRELEERGSQGMKKTGLLNAVSDQVQKARPAPLPPAPERLERLASLRVPALEISSFSQVLGGSRPALRLKARGEGYQSFVDFLEAAKALPFRVRLAALGLSPCPEGGGLSGDLVLEVEP